MGTDTKSLIGSKSHDCFRAFHKTALDKSFYASDVDLMLISKNPPGIVAAIEYKTGSDTITFTETILYATFLKMNIPVYIVTSDWRGSNAFTRFKVEKFLGGDWRPSPPKIKVQLVGKNMSQKAFERWEKGLRDDFTRTHGAK